MKYFFFLLIVFTSGCVSSSMGVMQRTDVHGVQQICWTPSYHFNSVVKFVANRMEGDPNK